MTDLEAFGGPGRPCVRTKTAGPHGTRRLWRPVLYQLSYGPRNRRGWKLPNPCCPWKARRPGPRRTPSAIRNRQSATVKGG